MTRTIWDALGIGIWVLRFSPIAIWKANGLAEPLLWKYNNVIRLRTPLVKTRPRAYLWEGDAIIKGMQSVARLIEEFKVDLKRSNFNTHGAGAWVTRLCINDVEYSSVNWCIFNVENSIWTAIIPILDHFDHFRWNVACHRHDNHNLLHRSSHPHHDAFLKTTVYSKRSRHHFLVCFNGLYYIVTTYVSSWCPGGGWTWIEKWRGCLAAWPFRPQPIKLPRVGKWFPGKLYQTLKIAKITHHKAIILSKCPKSHPIKLPKIEIQPRKATKKAAFLPHKAFIDGSHWS